MTRQVLLLRLGEELFGLEVEHIQEVVEAPPLHYIPRAPQRFIGAINFHGTILPILDLALCQGFETAPHDPRIVVLTPALATLGLAVHELGRIVPLPAEGLEPQAEAETPGVFIRGVFSHAGEMVNLLDMPRLLTTLDRP